MTEDAEEDAGDDAAVGPSATGTAPVTEDAAADDATAADEIDDDATATDAAVDDEAATNEIGDDTPAEDPTPGGDDAAADQQPGGDEPADQQPDGVETADRTGAEETDEERTADVAASEQADGDEQASNGDEMADDGTDDDVPRDVREYTRFSKVDGAQYERVNEFLRDRTYITAREWAIARLCADFRTETGVEMTKIGENLPELVPFMTDTYSPQAVNQARSAFEDKVRMAGATFLYGAMSDFFTADELDDLMYEVTEVAKFLLEVEGVDLAVEEELESEEQISSVMREVRQASTDLRHDETECPHCGHEISADADD